MEEPGRLQSMGSLGVRHIWVTSLSLFGEGNSNPLQYSCLENPRDGGAWWAAVYGVAQSRTWLKRLSSSSSGNQKGNTKTSFQGLTSHAVCQGWADLTSSQQKATIKYTEKTIVTIVSRQDQVRREAQHCRWHSWWESPGGEDIRSDQRHQKEFNVWGLWRTQPNTTQMRNTPSNCNEKEMNERANEKSSQSRIDMQ